MTTLSEEAEQVPTSATPVKGVSDACHRWNIQTVYEAAGGADGLLRLADAWHARVMANEVVSNAFSQGHPEHNRRLAAYHALVDVGLGSDDRLRQVLHDYFAWTTVTTT